MTELNRACILIAEGDVLIRNLISTVLSNQGHLVLAAANKAEALELSRNFTGEIRLLIGRSHELAEIVTGQRPAVRVVLLLPSMAAELKEIVRMVEPGAFRGQAAFPPKLSELIRRALTEPDFGGAFAEI